MNEKLIGAQPFYCDKVSRDIVLAIFEDEYITGDSNQPVTMVRLTECLSYGEGIDCKTCATNTKRHSM
mgnify:FL=1